MAIPSMVSTSIGSSQWRRIRLRCTCVVDLILPSVRCQLFVVLVFTYLRRQLRLCCCYRRLGLHLDLGCLDAIVIDSVFVSLMSSGLTSRSVYMHPLSPSTSTVTPASPLILASTGCRVSTPTLASISILASRLKMDFGLHW